jgi:1-acyl-sn-glycerol-3-phosphate acyltransferase
VKYCWIRPAQLPAAADERTHALRIARNWDLLKLAVRSLAFNIFFYVFTAFCSVAAMLLAIAWPSRLHSMARFWSLGWLYAYNRICGVEYEVQGAENVPAGSCIIAMKHQSIWESCAVFAILSRPIFILKSELMWIPIFGWVMKWIGCIAVKRGAGRAALTSMIRGGRQARSRGNQVVIFPEGTRSAPGSQASYKSGVSHLYSALNLPCVPVALNSGFLWPRRRFLRPPGLITVRILPAIPAGQPRQQMFDRMMLEIETASQRLNNTRTAR